MKKRLTILAVLLASLAATLVFKYANFNSNNTFVTYIVIFLSLILSLELIYLPKNLIKLWLIIITIMTAFGFLMVPLYNVFCDVTGLNGKLDLSVASAVPDGVDFSRQITVEFVVNHNEKMPWKFKPKHTVMVVHPGQLAKTAYFASNPTKVTMEAQAIPSIAPAKVAKYFKKVKCFCFSSQTLAPGESRYLTLYYYLDKNFPKDVNRLTLSYTLFDISKR
jgi:cytochrome c oxidase assembly protein subunit 11